MCTSDSAFHAYWFARNTDLAPVEQVTAATASSPEQMLSVVEAARCGETGLLPPISHTENGLRLPEQMILLTVPHQGKAKGWRGCRLIQLGAISNDICIYSRVQLLLHRCTHSKQISCCTQQRPTILIACWQYHGCCYMQLCLFYPWAQEQWVPIF